MIQAIHLSVAATLETVGSVFVTFAFNVVFWSYRARYKHLEEYMRKVDGHENDLVAVFTHLGIRRPVIR